MSKKITLENVDSSELPEVPVIGEVKQIRFTQDMELVSTLADSDLFMIQAGADLEARPNTITFDLIIKNLSGPIEEGSKKFVTGDMMFKVIGDMNLLDTWDNTNLVSSLNATYVNVRRIEEELRREINRSTGKDEQHDEQIANLRQDLTSTNEMLNQEINRSVAKDNEHDELLAGLRDDVDSTSDKLDAEIDRSTAKDAEHDTLLKGLRVDVNANKSAIESEVARSTARDEAHDAAIAKNASDITTEVNRAKAEEAKIRQEMQTADTNLQNAITAETERATGVEEDLQQQITDLSGSTDDRLDALEALSHEQNTDTGTTSKTFIIDSGNTGAMLKAEGGGLSTRTKGDAGYANFTVQNLVIKGDVTQEGDTFITQAERVEVRDNMILINEGETGAGVTAGFAGIEVDRGTEQNFMFGFNESDGMFKIGKEGNMFDVALRQPVGDMIDGMFASWDAATKTFKTTNLIPPTLQLYLGVPEVSIKYLSSDDGSIKFMTNGMGWSAFTSSMYTNFRSDRNKFQFIGELGVSTGIYDTIDENFTIRTKGTNILLLNKSKSVLNSSLTATSFFRSSDDAEVLYATDQTSLTDGMFLSWDATNNKVVTTNMVPKGTELYIGDKDVSIKYYDDSGRKSVVTYTGKGYFYVRSSEKSFTSFGTNSPQGFQFLAPIESSTGKINSLTDNLTLGTIQGSGRIKLYIGESSYITTPFSAVTFKRSSDDSEVLYQADLKSVLTGKETNYAPTVKAVSDAIDAVNTGTTESLKNYLPLAGGTMTGSITMPNSVFLKAKNVGGTAYNVISVNANNNVEVGNTSLPLMLVSSSVDIIHYRDGAGYKMWDIKNLPDPATKSGNNAFTGTNSFVGGKFSVAGSESEVYVSAVGSLVTRSTYGTTGWTRSLEFSDNDVVVARFGVKAITTDNVPTVDFVGILVGRGTVNDSQYKFGPAKITVPKTWILVNSDGDGLILNDSSKISFGKTWGTTYIRSGNTDLYHYKGGPNYKIWDASNLPTPASTSDIPDVSDMAKKSEANTFTAQNTFTAGQFNVGPFEVTNLGSLSINMSNSSPWERYLIWSNNSAVTSRIMFGGYGNGDTANYAWIGIGDVNYTNAQYIFAPTNMQVPLVWSLDDLNGNSLVWSQASDLVKFGRSSGTTKIRSGNVDLIHMKGQNEYKILDESNYSQYLPTTSKWTYGFVGLPLSKGLDLNTVLNGPDKPKAISNYTEPNYLLNSPTNSSYGTAWQLWNSLMTGTSLSTQLYFDFNHNIENGTRYMYFRTCNNKGFGDSSNWKRVVTEDENVAAYHFDSDNYPSLKYINGNVLSWLRSPIAGFIPNTQVSLASGGKSSIGTSAWAFQNAYIANVYANKYLFGTTGVDFSLDTNNKIAATISGSPRGIEVGDLLVSSNYGADTTKVPTNGIFSSGIIKSYSGFSSDSRINNLNISRVSNDALHISSFAGENVINKPGVDPVSGLAIGDGVALTYFWAGDFAFQLVGDIDGSGMAYRRYTPSTGNSTAWKFLADTNWVNTKLGGYLPLTGGVLTGTLTIGTGNSLDFYAGNEGSGGGVGNKTHGGIWCWFSKDGGVVVGNSQASHVTLRTGTGQKLYHQEGTGSKYQIITERDLTSYATQSWTTSNFYPLAGKGFLSFDANGRPVMANNQGYSAKDKDGIAREIMLINTNNALYIGNTGSNNAIVDVVFKYGGNTLNVSNIVQKSELSKYLPLTGGTLSGQLTINSTSNSLILNNASSSGTESFIKVQIKGTDKATIGFLSGSGSYIHNYENSKYLFVGTDGAYFGTPSSKARLLTSADLSGYATQTWANSKFAPLSTFKILSSYPAIVNTGDEFILTSSHGGIYVNYRTPSDTIIPTTWYWKNGTSTGYANGYWGNLYIKEKPVATQEWVSDRGYLTGITKSMVTTALGYTPPTTNTTYSQATSSTLGLVKIGATGLAAKNYAVQLNSSGQMYVAVPWTDTNSTYSAATSSTYGLVKIGATGLAAKNYAVQLNSSGQMYVSVPWTDTDTNTHYTTRLYAGASGTAANAAASNPYLKVTDDNTYRNQVRFIGAGATSISSDASGNITITSTNTTYGLASSSSNGLMSSSQYTKLSNCIETVSAANMVTSVQVVDTIPGESSQVTGRLYLKFA